MLLERFVPIVLAAISAVAAPPPLPGLRVEPMGGGSIFFVKNAASQPLTAYLIELVDYPGSSYAFLQDDAASPIAPGAEKRIEVTSMTVGAVPDYVKMQAALYADGTSAGAPGKVAKLTAHREVVLNTTRELLRRVTQAHSAEALKQDLIAWRNSLPKGLTRALAESTINDLDMKTPQAILATLRATEELLSK